MAAVDKEIQRLSGGAISSHTELTYSVFTLPVFCSLMQCTKSTATEILNNHMKEKKDNE